MGIVGLVIVVKGGDPEGVLNMRWFSLDDVVYINVAVDDFDGITWGADESFDIIFRRIGGIFKDYHIPDFWFDKLINIFQDEDAVAVTDPVGIVIDRNAAKGTGGMIISLAKTIGSGFERVGRDITFRIGGTGSGIDIAFGSEAEVVTAGAFRASEREMGSPKGVGHTAGGDDKGFDDKGTKDKSEHKSHYQRFSGFSENMKGVFLM